MMLIKEKEIIYFCHWLIIVYETLPYSRDHTNVDLNVTYLATKHFNTNLKVKVCIIMIDESIAKIKFGAYVQWFTE